MQSNQNHLCPGYIKAKVKAVIVIMTKEDSRIEMDHIAEIGWVYHHTEENHSLERILREKILAVELEETLEITIGLIEAEGEINSFPVISEEIKE